MAKYKASYRGIGKMLRADFLRDDMVRKAERVKRQAEATAPVDESGPHPGRYRDSFKVSSGVTNTGGRRAYARVENDSPEAPFVEFGNSKVEAHQTLRRALLILYSGGA